MAHQQLREMLKEHFEPFANKTIPEIQKHASKLQSYNADYEISKNKVEAAVLAGDLKIMSKIIIKSIELPLRSKQPRDLRKCSILIAVTLL